MASPRRQKDQVTLVRQDTFNLEKEEFQAKLNHKNRARSSYGIDAILERAEQMSSLAPEVREYLESHMRMMGEENSRMMAEVTKLRAEVILTNSDCDKKVKNASQQLERERAKNKMLASKVRIGARAAGSEDIIMVAGEGRPVTMGSKSEERVRPATVTSVTSEMPGTPPLDGAGEEARIHTMSMKIKVYRSVQCST